MRSEMFSCKMIVAVGCSFLIVCERSLKHAAVYPLTAKHFQGPGPPSLLIHVQGGSNFSFLICCVGITLCHHVA